MIGRWLLFKGDRKATPYSRGRRIKFSDRSMSIQTLNFKEMNWVHRFDGTTYFRSTFRARSPRSPISPNSSLLIVASRPLADTLSVWSDSFWPVGSVEELRYRCSGWRVRTVQERNERMLAMFVGSICCSNGYWDRRKSAYQIHIFKTIVWATQSGCSLKSIWSEAIQIKEINETSLIQRRLANF